MASKQASKKVKATSKKEVIIETSSAVEEGIPIEEVIEEPVIEVKPEVTGYLVPILFKRALEFHLLKAKGRIG